MIRWQAVIRSDRPSGIRVYPGANAQRFAQLGLRPGDLVLAINDSPLADQANGEQFIRSLAGTPQARLTIDADKFYKIWGQNVTLFMDARNVLDATNIQNLSPGRRSPFINTAGDEYTIYYTETGRTGGAYLQDVNGDNILDWVPTNDPRVFEEGRNVRMGISVTF